MLSWGELPGFFFSLQSQETLTPQLQVIPHIGNMKSAGYTQQNSGFLITDHSRKAGCLQDGVKTNCSSYNVDEKAEIEIFSKNHPYQSGDK